MQLTQDTYDAAILIMRHAYPRYENSISAFDDSEEAEVKAENMTMTLIRALESDHSAGHIYRAVDYIELVDVAGDYITKPPPHPTDDMTDDEAWGYNHDV